jgi:hypothetical protein
MAKVLEEIANAGWQQGVANRKLAVDFWSPNGGILVSSYQTMPKSPNLEEIANAG